MLDGWVKNWRKIEDWGWYKTPHMAHLFQHLIRRANHAPKEWDGQVIERGQVVIGRAQLAKDTGVSERSIRTFIKRLKSTSEVTVKTTNKYSIITILNYSQYQGQDDSERPAKRPAKRPTNDQQTTTNKNDKNEKNISISTEADQNQSPDGLPSLLKKAESRRRDWEQVAPGVKLPPGFLEKAIKTLGEGRVWHTLDKMSAWATNKSIDPKTGKERRQAYFCQDPEQLFRNWVIKYKQDYEQQDQAG